MKVDKFDNSNPTDTDKFQYIVKENNIYSFEIINFLKNGVKLAYLDMYVEK